MTTIYTYSSLRLQWIIDDAVLTRTTWSSVRMWYMVGTKKREVEVTRSGSTFAASLDGPLDAGVYNCYLDFEGSGEVQYEEQVQSAFYVTTLQAEAENADGSTVTVVLEGDHARASSVVVEEPETQVTELMPNRMQRLYCYSTATLVWDLSKELAARPELGSLRASFAYRVGGKPSVETSAWITGAKAHHTLSNPMVDGVYSCYVRWYGNDGNVVFEAQSLQAFMVCREQGETLNPDGGAVTVNIAQSKVRQVVTIPLEEGADDLSESKLPILYTYGNVNIVWDLSREVNVRPELRGMALEFVCQTDSSVRTEDVSWNGDKVEASLAGPVEAGVWSCFLRFKNGGKTELLMTVLQAWQSAEMQGAVLNPDGATVTLNLRSGRVLNTVITPLVDPTDIAHLGDLMDVDLKSHVPQAGEVLKYDDGTWVSGSVAWNEVSGKPAWLTPEVPDLSAFGNRAGYIKGVTSDMVTGALGYTPLKSVGWTDVADKPEWLTMTMPDLGDFGNMAGYIKRNEINETAIVDALGYSPKELTGYLRLLNDVDVSDAQDGYALVYNSAAGMWRPGLVKGGGGGVDPTIYLTKSEAESKYLTKDEFEKWFFRYDYPDGSDWAIGAKKDFFSLKGVAAYGPFKYGSGGEGGEGGVSSFAALSEVIGAGAPESYPKYWGMKDAETYGWMDAKGVGNFAGLGDIGNTNVVSQPDSVWGKNGTSYGWTSIDTLKPAAKDVSFDSAYTGVTAFIGQTDVQGALEQADKVFVNLRTAIIGKYTKPENGIPNSDLEHSSMTLWGNPVALGGTTYNDIELKNSAGASVKIGVDDNGNLRAYKTDGSPANFYATGGVAAYGYGASSEPTGAVYFSDLLDVPQVPVEGMAWGYKDGEWKQIKVASDYQLTRDKVLAVLNTTDKGVLSSGITSSKVSAYDTHIATTGDTTIHHTHSNKSVLDKILSNSMTLWGNSVALGGTTYNDIELKNSAGASVKIGVDDNGNLRAYKTDGSPANFYATGGVAAYGYAESSKPQGASYFRELLDVPAITISNAGKAWGVDSSGQWGLISAGKEYTGSAYIDIANNTISLKNIPWSKITDRPTKLSQFTDDLPLYSLKVENTRLKLLKGNIEQNSIPFLRYIEGTTIEFDKTAGNAIMCYGSAGNPWDSSETKYGEILQWGFQADKTPGANEGSIWYSQLIGDTDGKLYYRNIVNQREWTSIKELAFTTSKVASAETADTASRLSATSKTAWGKTYWTSGGVPTSIDGDMKNVGTITHNVSNDRRAEVHFDGNAWWLGITKDSTTHQPIIVWDRASNGNTDMVQMYGLHSLQSGNVGIGTNNPSHKLSVNGDISFGGNYALRWGVDSALSLGGSLDLGWGTSTAKSTIIYGKDIQIRYRNVNSGVEIARFGRVNGSDVISGTGAIGMHIKDTIRIGDALLSYDTTNKALKISDINGGGQMHLYATGGVAAYSAIGSGFDTLSNLSLSDSLSVSNKITTNGLSANTVDMNTLTAKTQLTIGTDASGKAVISPKKRSASYQGILVDGFISVGKEFSTQESAGYKLNTTTLYVENDLKVGPSGTGIKNIQVKTPSGKSGTWLCFTVGDNKYGVQLTSLTSY